MSAPASSMRSRSTRTRPPSVPGRPRPRRLLPLQAAAGGRRPAQPGEPDDFRLRPAVGHCCARFGARAALVTKSPQTGLYLFCITGGLLGPAIKHSGFDVIILTGRSEKPGLHRDRRRPRQAARRHPPLGPRHALRAGVHPRRAGPRPAGDHLHRPGRREAGSVRLSAQRAPGAGPRRRRRRHGLQERQGPGRAGRSEAAPVGDQPAFKAAVKKVNAELRSHPFTSGPLKMYGSVSTVAVTLNSGIMPADNWQRSRGQSAGRGPPGRDPARASPGQGRALRRPLPQSLLQGDGGARGPLCRRDDRGARVRDGLRAGQLVRHLRPGRRDRGRPALRSMSVSTRSRQASPSPSPWSASRRGC